MAKSKKIGVVYSTNPSFNFQFESEPCFETLPPEKQDLRVHRESKHRGGKTAIVIRGFVGTVEDMETLSKILKTKCGVGGSVKDGEIIVQGDIRDKVCSILQSQGYKFKSAGG